MSSAIRPVRIAVLLTCFNRKDKTLFCLEALFRNNLSNNYLLDIFVLDDGSLDGTSNSIAQIYPNVNLFHGTGNLFWNGGMRALFSATIHMNFDFYIWLNDDTLLFDSAITKLISSFEELLILKSTPCILVGSTKDQFSNQVTYGGLVRYSSFRKTKFRLLHPTDKFVRCETMNGNCVMIPNQIAKKLVNLDEKYIHGLGDFDYGLRATAAGYPIFIIPGFVGECSQNSLGGTYHDDKLNLVDRWSKFLSPKGLPVRPWLTFTKRHAGFYWFIYWIYPYVKFLFQSLLSEIVRMCRFRK